MKAHCDEISKTVPLEKNDLRAIDAAKIALKGAAKRITKSIKAQYKNYILYCIIIIIIKK